jgi:hypothetical protein
MEVTSTLEYASPYASRYSVFLLYWYKSTNTGAEDPSRDTGQYASPYASRDNGLLHWYKSTGTHAEDAARDPGQ